MALKKFRRYLFAPATAAALLFTGFPTMASGPLYEQGLEAVGDYRYSVALMNFTAAAERGDRDAQRSLGLMLLYGERLYGSDVHLDRQRGERWLRAAAAQGCEVSSFMLKVLARGAD